MTVEELLARVSSAELTEWQAFEQVEGPLGGRRDDTLAALVSFYVASALGAKRLKLSKLMPEWDRRPQDPADMEAYVRALNRRFGGEEVGHGDTR